MAGWRECALGDVITLQRGFDLPRRDRRDGAYPVMSSSGQTGTHAEAKVRGPGVVTGRYGTLGQVFYVDGDYWPLNTALFVSNFKGNDPRYVSLLLAAMHLERYDGAAAVPGLNRNFLHRLPVRLPDRQAQARLAAVFGAIDDLIENNRRRVVLLEQMAREVYHEWFVRFRYPGHESVPLVDSPLGPIPDGWRVGPIGSLCCRIQAGGTPRRSVAGYWDPPEVDWYTTGDLTDSVLIHSSERISQLAVESSASRLFEPNTILLAIYGSPTVGRLGLVRARSCANQAALGLVAEPSVMTTAVLWHLLEAQRDYFNQIAQGAAQQNISKAKVASAPVVIPPYELVTRLTETIAPTWTMSHRLVEQTYDLSQLRALLLPKLVTGQIDMA